jgi:hypothetical protein
MADPGYAVLASFCTDPAAPSGAKAVARSTPQGRRRVLRGSPEGGAERLEAALRQEIARANGGRRRGSLRSPS